MYHGATSTSGSPEKPIMGFQSVPVDWGINSERKKGFFNLVKEITGTEFQ
jgi:hypothetical protein